MRLGPAREVQSVPALPSAPVETGYPTYRRFPVAPPAVGRAEAAAGHRTAWWLWPHLLSLDAPLVAVVWQACWAQSAHVRLSWCHPCVLGLGVWLIYLVDRLVDSARAVPGDIVTARHAFHARRRVGLSCS